MWQRPFSIGPGQWFDGVSLQIPVDRQQIAEFCRVHHIRRLAIFGSARRNDFGPKSDVDILVEFEPNHVPGLAFFSLELELSELFGRRVDLNAPAFLSKYFRDEVQQQAQVLYASLRHSPHGMVRG